MLKRQRAIFVVVLLLALSVHSWGHPRRSPAKLQQEQAQTQQQKATPDQRGTEQSPFIVQPLAAKKSAEETANETRDAKEKANSDWWTWFLSILTVLALFGQLAVFIAQAYFLKGTLKATATAANAANVSATVAKNSLIIATRPHIAIPPPNLCEANEFVAAPHICFSLTNGGNIAVVDKVQATIEVIRHSGQVGLKKTSSFIPVGREIEIGQMLGEYSVRLDDFGICDLQEIRSGETPLKIIFQIISKDMFGNDHKPTFSFDFDHGKSIFLPSKLLKPENRQQTA